jgi:putative toxin-antitoxin system antitoxin component (TIGR02293 family)
MSTRRQRVSRDPSEIRPGRTARFRPGAGGETWPPLRISIEQVRRGLPLKELDDLAGTLHVDRVELAQILGTSVRTLQRKAEASNRLAAAASDRLARIVRIHEHATRVLGSGDKASAWLTSRSRALGEVPLRMLDTDIGTQRVEQELRQIEFGMPF